MPRLDRKLLGAHIRAARVRRDMTQDELGAAVGVLGDTIGRIERGAFEPSLSTMVALAEVLGGTVDAFIRGSAKAARPPAKATAPLVERLSERAAELDATALRTLVTVAEMLPASARKH